MDYYHQARLTLAGREGLAKCVVEGRVNLREAAAERAHSAECWQVGSAVSRGWRGGSAGPQLSSSPAASANIVGACRDLNIKLSKNRFYTPRTNGEAERFIQTAIRKWAYARRYQISADRAAELHTQDPPVQLAPPHASLGQLPPISRSGIDVNNLLRHHILITTAG